jgi:hypothetical protein
MASLKGGLTMGEFEAAMVEVDAARERSFRARLLRSSALKRALTQQA